MGSLTPLWTFIGIMKWGSYVWEAGPLPGDLFGSFVRREERGAGRPTASTS
jgi:hypothetical protein